MTAALAETHTAVVVLAGDRAYKAKKPVRFPFVDLTTPELRHLPVGLTLTAAAARLRSPGEEP